LEKIRLVLGVGILRHLAIRTTKQLSIYIFITNQRVYRDNIIFD